MTRSLNGRRDSGFSSTSKGSFGFALLLAVFLTAACGESLAQAGQNERTYNQSKTAVQRALKELQPAMSGRLPTLEGFASAGDHPLSRYERAYFQSAVQITPTASGGSVVRVNTKVTAWYRDSTPARSGYQLLTSNGRLESDLLDQLSELLVSTTEKTSSSSSTTGKTGGDSKKENSEATIAAPMPHLPETSRTFPSAEGLSAQQLAANTSQKISDKPASGLQAEAASLEEVLKNQAHPKNLVAIKKSGTPVVATPSLSGKTLFLATAHDEFEMLDFNADWVHVRISGLSRGWIWRTGLEMPEGISDVPANTPRGAPVAADLFQISREETAPFPGDWEPLRGKSVRIISVQKIQESENGSGSQAKLEFAKSLLDKNYAVLADTSAGLAGIVLIFDSVDGGMIAATLPTVQQWKAGTLSDAALWHQCYFDPPEMYGTGGPAGSR